MCGYQTINYKFYKKIKRRNNNQKIAKSQERYSLRGLDTVFSSLYFKYRNFNIIFPDWREEIKGYVAKHVLVMEKKLGRYLKKGEVVHHINGNKLDNRSQNLKLFKNKLEHINFHAKKRKKK